MTPALLAASIHPLATIDALLNATAATLLVIGHMFIRRGNERAHKTCMLSAFAVSTAFLVCYLAYHVWPVGAKDTPFSGQGPVRIVYFAILISHVLLAITVPFFAVGMLYLGLTDRRVTHVRLARWAWPIWLYVSVTGVVIYAMLYYLYPAAA